MKRRRRLLNVALNFTCAKCCCDCGSRRHSAYARHPAASSYFTLAAGGGPWHGRTVQILDSRSSLHRGFSLVTREETPMPQLREHGDQSVVWTGHFLSALGRRHSTGVTHARDRSLSWASLLLPRDLRGLFGGMLGQRRGLTD